MVRLPNRFAPFVYGVIQAAVTTAVATAIATHQWMGFGLQFLELFLQFRQAPGRLLQLGQLRVGDLQIPIEPQVIMR